LNHINRIQGDNSYGQTNFRGNERPFGWQPESICDSLFYTEVSILFLLSLDSLCYIEVSIYWDALCYIEVSIYCDSFFCVEVSIYSCCLSILCFILRYPSILVVSRNFALVMWVQSDVTLIARVMWHWLCVWGHTSHRRHWLCVSSHRRHSLCV